MHVLRGLGQAEDEGIPIRVDGADCIAEGFEGDCGDRRARLNARGMIRCILHHIDQDYVGAALGAGVRYR